MVIATIDYLILNFVCCLSHLCESAVTRNVGHGKEVAEYRRDQKFMVPTLPYLGTMTLGLKIERAEAWQLRFKL